MVGTGVSLRMVTTAAQFSLMTSEGAEGMRSNGSKEVWEMVLFWAFAPLCPFRHSEALKYPIEAEKMAECMTEH